MTLHEMIQEVESALLKAAKVMRDIKREVHDRMEKEYITKEEYTALMWELDGWPDIAKAIHKNYSITTLELLEKKELPTVRARIREIKKTYDLRTES